jgi:hypothetical protein
VQSRAHGVHLVSQARFTAACVPHRGRLLPWFAWPAGFLIAVGLYGGLVLAQADYQQGDAFRIVYVHAPSAWLSMLVYGTMAIAAAIGLVWRIKLRTPCGSRRRRSARHSRSSRWRPARSGASRCGVPVGVDARLTSELLLSSSTRRHVASRSIDERDRADRASALLAIVGIVNLPIIHYSRVLVEYAAPGIDLDEAAEALDDRRHALAPSAMLLRSRSILARPAAAPPGRNPAARARRFLARAELAR